MSKENSHSVILVETAFLPGFPFSQLERQGVGHGTVKLALSAVGVNCAHVSQNHTYRYHTDRKLEVGHDRNVKPMPVVLSLEYLC